MRVLVTGASGLVGTALVPALRAAGHDVVRLVRRTPRAADERRWSPESGQVEPAAVAGADALVHLAGENIGARRWTRERKRAIRESRVTPTRLLAEALARGPGPIQAMVCASAVGFYGDRGDEPLTEASPAGLGFLAGVVQEWEAAATPAARAGVRVVHLRSGAVLTPGGGMLGRLVPLFRWGFGGPLGRGDQWLSWITRDDLVGVMRRALEDPALAGPVHAVAPEPVRQREFARALGSVLGRPALLPAPRFALRWVLGEMADELLMFSQRAIPARLAAAGHRMRDPELGPALARFFAADRRHG